MKSVKIVVRPIKSSFSKSKARKMIKEWVASEPEITITKEEIEAGRKSVRESLIRAGYTKKEAFKMTNRKSYF